MDQEGGMLSTEFIKVLNENKIEPKTTLNHAPYAEVFIRTLKQMIYDRLHGEGLKIYPFHIEFDTTFRNTDVPLSS